jgi:hypothetical protein
MKMRILGGYTPCYMFIQTQLSSQVGDIPINPYEFPLCLHHIPIFCRISQLLINFCSTFFGFRREKPPATVPGVIDSKVIRTPNGACESIEGLEEKGSANHVGHVDGQIGSQQRTGIELWLTLAMGNGQWILV